MPCARVPDAIIARHRVLVLCLETEVVGHYIDHRASEASVSTDRCLTGSGVDVMPNKT